MTELAFHFGAEDTLGYTCRLLRKAVGSGARVVVRANATVSGALDRALWNLSPVDFLAHCDASAAAAVRVRSPVFLAGESPPTLLAGEAPFTVLVNLATSMPDPIDSYARVIEIVGTEEADRQAARARWKEYKSRGLSIVQHDLTRR